MKRFFLVFVGLILVTSYLTAGVPLNFIAQEGDWNLQGSRLYQGNESKGALMAHLTVPQDGLMAYNFNVKYEGGAVGDLHGGFGIHIFVEDPSFIDNSWGNGDSVLLWLNFDSNPVLDEIPVGLSAEIYHSTNDSLMDLVGAYDLNEWSSLLTSDVEDLVIPVKLVVNGRTGDAWIQSPLDSSVKYVFNVGQGNLKGDYVSLRTNGMAVSFGY